ncbi:uncharacterized protein VDAG_03606 [Verticillium dahliae VdLs.17]|uniref:Transcription factor domain-containing protein n=1 Tax=Verticillium dahliae (strain VdLs.17 / ATCC MYA-4575 / FGSC 10137) TaxID=498257 RepID=G2X1J5_VERDV|nr:uncharacterized protein VDAG_03606 [Verticillium dahliae VdLs.17]EGY22168.1 hypothetical protein VDAG_03606 [Verticillium dahliae VdLs.17]
MSIGTASRLKTLRVLIRQASPAASDTEDADVDALCYWSVFILEKAFSPTYTVLSSQDDAPALPSNPCLLPGVSEPAFEAVQIGHQQTQDPKAGIVSSSVQIISIWGDICAYLSSIRKGKTEVPWSSNSTYSQIQVQLHQFELDLAPPHRFENILVKQRSPSELHSYGEYWSPWTIMQLTSHAALTVLNHPFLHLVALRGRECRAQPKLFMQHIIDQSLFHTGWVIRLLQTFEEMGLEINDPLMGHQVAATAIIPCLFQFSQDQQMASKAREGLYLCERFLERLSVKWPHIRHKLNILRQLHSAAESRPDSSTITFDQGYFWDILVSPPSYGAGDGSSPLAATSAADDPRSTLHVTTKFVQPWPDEQTRLVSQVDPPFFSQPSASNDEQILLDDLFSQFQRSEAVSRQNNKDVPDTLAFQARDTLTPRGAFLTGSLDGRKELGTGLSFQ